MRSHRRKRLLTNETDLSNKQGNFPVSSTGDSHSRVRLASAASNEIEFVHHKDKSLVRHEEAQDWLVKEVHRRRMW